MKYQHLDFPGGPTQGPPQSTKTTPRPLQDLPETLWKNIVSFGCLPGTPKDLFSSFDQKLAGNLALVYDNFRISGKSNGAEG